MEMQKDSGSYINLISHPGETLIEVMEGKGVSQQELATRCGVTPKHINEITKGKKDISGAMAHKLANVFPLSASFWNSLQSNYDEEIQKILDEEHISKEEIEIAKKIPYKELVDYGYVPSGAKSEAEKVIALRSFMGVSSLLYILDSTRISLSKGAFRISSKASVDPYSLATWIRMCYLSDNPHVGAFSKEKLRGSLAKLKEQMFCPSFNDSIKNMKRILSDSGVSFEIIHSIRGAPVQGYISFIQERAILCLTLRYHYEDIFWFTFFHEIGHLLSLREQKKSFVDFIVLPKEDESEKEANEFALKTLFPSQKGLQGFLSLTSFSEASVLAFAKESHILPSIVVGQLGHKDEIYYKRFSRLRPTIDRGQ